MAHTYSGPLLVFAMKERKRLGYLTFGLGTLIILWTLAQGDLTVEHSATGLALIGIGIRLILSNSNRESVLSLQL